MQTPTRRSSFVGTRLFALLLCGLLVAWPALRAGAAAGTPTPTPSPVAAQPPQQPGQPATGPGGADLAYDGLRAQHYGPQPDGTTAPTGYWLFEPLGPRSGATPTAQGALPLVLFFHGFDAVDPESYHVWIDHVVRRGAVVVYPDFQAANLPFDEPTIAALEHRAPGDSQAAVRAALAELARGGHAAADLTRVAAVGHSMGGVLALAYAGQAAALGLPVPAAVLAAMPGCTACDLSAVATIPAATRVLVLVGNQDTLAGEDTAKHIWARLGQVPADHKDYVRLIGDAHGQPPTVADHFVAMTAGFSLAYVDALDWFGTWKWLDALMSCSFAGKDCQYAFGNTPAQRFMGTWSDGVPIAEPQVTDDPGTPTPGS
jgi:acetyl esterase/lipase